MRLPAGATNLTPAVCVCSPRRLPLLLTEVGCASMLCEPDAETLYGVGHRQTYHDAAAIAAAEAAERYAAAIFPPDEQRWTCADDLGDAALDLATIPRCSDAELAYGDCPLVAPPAPDVPIRWTESVDLLSGAPIWVPTVMVALGLRATPAERFWHQTSTGASVHVEPAAATVNAILESIERDAVACLWLQQLSLPRLDVNAVSEPVRAEIARRQATGIDTILLDATTDLGVPIVYAVEVARASALACHVAAACALDVDEAVHHALDELAVTRRTVLLHQDAPADPRACHGVVDGAVYLREHGSPADFDVLTAPRASAPPTSPQPPANPAAQLDLLLDRLVDRVGHVLVADLTTVELSQAGLCAVRAIIPDLMPVSFDHRARYLATPRLYDLPTRLGHTPRAESELTPLPQPFA